MSKKNNIKRFKHEKHKYWVDGIPYQLNGKDIVALAGAKGTKDDIKRIEDLKKFLNKNE